MESEIQKRFREWCIKKGLSKSEAETLRKQLQLEKFEKLNAEHDFYALRESLKREVRKEFEEKRKQVMDWKMLFYFKKNNETLALFDTGQGYVMNLKGGGHPVVSFQFEDRNELKRFTRKFLNGLGFRNSKSSRMKNGAGRYYV